MIPSIRQSFNQAFTKEKYEAFVTDISNAHPDQIVFRIAETAVFVPKTFSEKMLQACENIVDIILSPHFKQLTQDAIPKDTLVQNEGEHCEFIAFDFGVCVNENGVYEPQLIEMQGFPTIFAYEVLMDDMFQKHFPTPENFSPYLNGYTRETYIELLKEILIGKYTVEEVVLLELFPEEQKTRIDFYCTKDYVGINTVCVTKLIKEGRKLFYENEGKRIEIKRVYNRIIFDELRRQPEEVQEKAKILFEELEVEWVPHPSWFFRISKYTLPFIDNPFVPKTYFLNKLDQLPDDLENYVLKPLFSFAGLGVIIDVTKADIEQISDPENWILQQKVKYAEVVETPDVPAKVEIRIFYFWKPGTPRPIAVNNLARMSKGKMIGVRYNADKEWVGGSYCLIEQ